MVHVRLVERCFALLGTVQLYLGARAPFCSESSRREYLSCWQRKVNEDESFYFMLNSPRFFVEFQRWESNRIKILFTRNIKKFLSDKFSSSKIKINFLWFCRCSILFLVAAQGSELSSMFDSLFCRSNDEKENKKTKIDERTISVDFNQIIDQANLVFKRSWTFQHRRKEKSSQLISSIFVREAKREIDRPTNHWLFGRIDSNSLSSLD